MKRTISVFMVGITVTVCCILWLTRRLRHPLEDSHSSGVVPSPELVSLVASVSSPASSPLPSLVEKEHTLLGPSGKKDWVIASLLLVITLCLIITWSYNLITNLISLPKAPQLDDQAQTVPIVSDSTSDQGTSTVPRGQLLGSTSPKAHGILTFTISQIKNETPTTGTFSGTFSVTIPSDLQAAICDETKVPNVMNAGDCPVNSLVATKQSISLCPSLPGGGFRRKSVYLLKQEYASKVLTLSVEPFPGSSSSTAPPLFSTTLPLQEIFPPPSPALLTLIRFPSGCGSAGLVSDPVHVSLPMTVTLPLRSQGQAYPDDWYVANAIVLITLPASLYVPDQLSGEFPIFYLPMDLRIAINSSMNSYAMKIEPGTTETIFPPGRSPEAFGANHLVLEVTRSMSFWWFVYSTTFLVPLAFFLLFFHVLFLSNRVDKEPLYATLLNILTMVVTVAAIRQLLIPGDLQGELTRLDLWLGWWGMVLLTLFFLNYTYLAVSQKKERR